MIEKIRSIGPARAIALSILLFCNACLAALLLADVPTLADIVTPLTGHIIGFGLAAALGLILSRHTGKAMAAGIAATLALHTWLGLMPSRAPALAASMQETAADSRDLTIISLNTWDAIDNVESLEAYFKTIPADVVVLSEIGPPKQHLLEALRSIYPYQTQCANDWACSLALISRVPFEQGGTVRWSKKMPAFVWARFPGSLTVVGTHIARPSRTPFLHARETDAIAQFVRRLEGSVVLAGDLNSSPWSYSFRSLKAQTGLVASRLLTPSWPAWPIAMPQIALDHILVSPDLSFAESRTERAVGSDHLPVFARLKRQPATVRAKDPPRNGGSRLAAAGLHLDAELLAHLGGEHGGAGNLRR